MSRPEPTMQTDPPSCASAGAAESKVEAVKSLQPLQTAKRTANPSLLRFYLRKWRKWLYDPGASQQLADLIKSKKFKEANELVSNPKTLVKIDPRFQDEQGNTYLHLAVMIGTKDMVKISTKVGCPQNIPNKKGQLPIDITSNFRDPKGVGSSRPDPFGTSVERKKRRAVFVEQMSQDYREEFSDAVFPGRRVVSTLDLYFECEEGRCDLPDTWPELNDLDRRRLTLHERLALANHISSAQAVTVETLVPDDPSNCYVTATLTLVVSKTPYVLGQKGHYDLIPITIPINVPEHIIYTQGNEYAHAEKVLFDYLNNLNILKCLVEEARRKALLEQPSHKCYAIIFDLHTTFDMCRDSCEEMMYTLQGNRSRGSLLANLELALEEAKFVLPEVRRDYELLTPAEVRLYVTTRVSSHKPFGNGSLPTDKKGYIYPSFDNSSARECNIANLRNAVVFHAQNEYEVRKSYRFSEQTQSSEPIQMKFVPAYVPCQTAFLMKPKPETRRFWNTKPVRFTQETQRGLFIDCATSARQAFRQANDLYLWKYVREGKVEIIQNIIAERRNNKKDLADFLLIRTAEGETIYHAAAISQRSDMLKLIDDTLAVSFPEERMSMLSDQRNSPLRLATSYETFLFLIKQGAVDNESLHLNQKVADFTDEQQYVLSDLYREKGWNRGTKRSFSSH